MAYFCYSGRSYGNPLDMKLTEMWAFCISGEQRAPNKTNLLLSRLGIFRFLYSERVSEVWEDETNLKLRCAYNSIGYGLLRNQIG